MKKRETIEFVLTVLTNNVINYVNNNTGVNLLYKTEVGKYYVQFDKYYQVIEATNCSRPLFSNCNLYLIVDGIWELEKELKEHLETLKHSELAELAKRLNEEGVKDEVK